MSMFTTRLSRIYMAIMIALWMCASSVYANVDFKQIKITSIDNATVLSANVFSPEQQHADQRFPAIIFINSWMMEEHEYIVQAHKFAQEGYIVLSYSARGWGQSGGVVGTAGPEDMNDLQAVLLWLKNNTPVDVNHIGAAGISYGAGIATMGLAHFPEIRTVAAMSGWADLYEAFYAQETPRSVWGGILLVGGYLTGRMDPIIAQLYTDMLLNKNIDKLESWARERSPNQYIDAINQRGVPTSIYISQNFEDELFQPNAIIHFYESLQVKKRFDMNQGIHATAELGGLLGVSNYIWNNVHAWFAQELKEESTSLAQQKPVSVAIKFGNEENREFYDSWPSDGIEETPLYLNSRPLIGMAKLAAQFSATKDKDIIYSGGITGMTSGIPAIGPIFESHLNIPVYSWLPGTNRLHSIYYQTDEFNTALQIRGIPKVTLSIKPSIDKVMLVGYLYDVDKMGVGRLITHAPFSLHHAKVGEWQDINMELIAEAYDVPKGHALALAFNTHDLPYAVPTLKPYSIEIRHTSLLNSVLTVPTRS